MTSPLSPDVIQDWAQRLHEARLNASAIPQLSASAELSLADAYAVQRAGIELRVAAGEKVAGAKLGFTSKAKAAQMGVSDVISGVLTDAMQVPAGGVFDVATAVHPRIEPEVAFRLGSDVDPRAPDADLRAAVDAVAAAMEIIDSRYQDFKFSLADVLADNTSGCAFVVGEWLPLADHPDLQLAERPVSLRFDDEVVEEGSTSDILGDPWEALPAMLRMAAAHGHELTKGGVILAGAATAAVAMRPGTTVSATIADLGTVSLIARDGRA